MHVIAHLSTYGAENLVAQLAARLDERGVEVSVLTVQDAPATSRSAVFRGPVFSAGRRHSRDFAFFFRMVRAMRRWRPGIVHTHTHNGKYWGRLAAIVAGVPRIVHTEHNSDFQASLIEKLGNRVLHSATARVVAFSEPHAQALARAERISPKKIAIIANGIEQTVPLPRDAARARLQITADDIAVFAIGRMQPVKNHRLALLSLCDLPATLAERAKLLILGEGYEETALRKLARELGLQDRVSFCGFRPDARELLSGADALLVTSWNEAMPLCVIEAMAARVPVVSTPWSGVEAVLPPSAGWISEGWAPQQVARALARALYDARNGSTRPDAARDLASLHYNISVTADRHAELYEALL